MSAELPPSDSLQTTLEQPKSSQSADDYFPTTAIRQAWELFDRLDFQGPSKRPSVLSVLRLYCIQGLTIPEIARYCRCSVGTVCNRLKLFRNATGQSPEHLRNPRHPHRGRPKRQI